MNNKIMNAIDEWRDSLHKEIGTAYHGEPSSWMEYLKNNLQSIREETHIALLPDYGLTFKLD